MQKMINGDDLLGMKFTYLQHERPKIDFYILIQFGNNLKFQLTYC